MINKLSSSKATGPDAISVKLLNMLSPVFSHPLTNLSIVKGTFPSKRKVARITPLYKMARTTAVIITDPFLYCPSFPK